LTLEPIPGFTLLFVEVDLTKDGYMLAGELAKHAGVSTDTLRHYERKRVLPGPRRSTSGYRMYTPDALERVRLIRRALAVGFTLDELAVILAERDRGGAPCQQVYALAVEKLQRVEDQLSELIALREDLKELVSSWGSRISKNGKGGPSRLLEALPERRNSAVSRSRPPTPKQKELKK